MLYYSVNISRAYFYKESFLISSMQKIRVKLKNFQGNGLKPQKIAALNHLKSVPVLCKIGSPVSSILLIPILPTVSPRAATTKLRFLNVMLTVTKTSGVSETVSYICFFTNPSLFTTKQPPDGDCSLISFFYFFTPTIDTEPNNSK